MVESKLNKFLKWDRAAEQKGGEILAIGEDEVNIMYDSMQGRPSVEIEIRGKCFKCLLDTGARVNVLSSKILGVLGEIHVEETDMKLRCANNSILPAVGEVTLETRIGNRVELIRYTVVTESWPDIIGGIELQRRFGFELRKVEEDNRDIHIGILEAKFGRVISDDERLRRAVKVFAVSKDKQLREVISKNRSAFMADNWDIGCTSLLKHKIVTDGEPVNTKPWRQPMHLEEKLNETLKKIF